MIQRFQDQAHAVRKEMANLVWMWTGSPNWSAHFLVLTTKCAYQVGLVWEEEYWKNVKILILHPCCLQLYVVRIKNNLLIFGSKILLLFIICAFMKENSLHRRKELIGGSFWLYLPRNKNKFISFKQSCKFTNIITAR